MTNFDWVWAMVKSRKPIRYAGFDFWPISAQSTECSYELMGIGDDRRQTVICIDNMGHKWPTEHRWWKEFRITLGALSSATDHGTHWTISNEVSSEVSSKFDGTIPHGTVRVIEV